METRRRQYLLLTLPALLLILCFIGVPLVNGIRISFFKWNGYSKSMKYIGFDNYIKAFSDKYFFGTVRNTLIYGFGSTFFQNVLGLASALLLNKKFKGRNAVRTILYMPIMISGFIMGHILYYFFQMDGGVFNEIIGWFGGERVYWTETGLKATLVCMAANSWQYMGICMIIYLAGLQNIPVMYQEAAVLDGASSIQVFRHVTVPLLIPSITTAVVINLIGGFKMYDVIVALTSGGPSRGSLSLSYYIQLLYFQDEKAGYASAVGVLMFFMILILTVPINAWLRKREVEA
ncbi:MAG: sugar ABC transporter permease [Clostridia bacterium]|nr:sugar ABC transporter permease [Clostridia bacterium]